MRPISYVNADIFLLFYAIDNPTSFHNIKHKWYPEVKKKNADIPLILVGTKADTREDTQIIEELRHKGTDAITLVQGKKLAKELGCISYIECSAISNKGFRDIFGQVIAAILNLRKGKRPGSTCWGTDCPTNFTVLSKKNKCIRCLHRFCSGCVVSLPKTHDFAGSTMCKKCKEIDEDEPLLKISKKKDKKKKGLAVSTSSNKALKTSTKLDISEGTEGSDNYPAGLKHSGGTETSKPASSAESLSSASVGEDEGVTTTKTSTGKKKKDKGKKSKKSKEKKPATQD
eukprot:TRINITY_DN278_c0_g1_i3.p1 TRINITY_DN278_c0_g1~~TRINITY_DN278_c0_g1_i3.p1  ORF type:complete len:286 (+),score=47.10 TRINITY_DN278_c0_g1_i3:413-1270(+)